MFREVGGSQIVAASVVVSKFCDHVPAHADVRESVDNPMYDADVNVLGSLNVFQQAVRTGARKVVFISSGGACYGEPIELPCRESHPIRPLSPDCM